MAARGSEWVSLKRSLIILRRLIAGRASSIELVQAVIDGMGAEAYPLADRARQAAFKHDRDNLRRNLEVDFFYDPRQRTYALRSPGPFASLELTPQHQRTLAMLYQVVLNRGDEFHQVRDLVTELIARLPADEQRKAIAFASAIDIKLEQFVGEGAIDNKIWSTIERAIQEKRKLSFHYQSSQAADAPLFYLEAAPLQIQFRNGTWFLNAIELLQRGPDGKLEHDGGYRRYRMTHIRSDDKLVVLPNVMTGGLRKAPIYRVHYRLSPSTTDDAVRRYFDEMQITHLSDGGSEVTGVTDDIQEAARLLANYAEDCIVLGGPELRTEVEQMVLKMAKNYKLDK